MKIRANGFIVFVPKYGSNYLLLAQWLYCVCANGFIVFVRKYGSNYCLSGHLPLCKFFLHDAAKVKTIIVT